jgi:hypothetical protein
MANAIEVAIVNSLHNLSEDDSRFILPEVLVSDDPVEQLAAGAHPTIPWSDDWTPDPILLAQAKLREPNSKAGQ